MHRLFAPRLNWQGDAPRSADYGDIFYHPKEGRAESKHVFLEGCGLPSRFGDAHHTVFELGFGSGLNLFNTWQCWQQHISAGNTANNDWLTYIAIEHRPWVPTDICRAMSAFPALSPMVARFLTQYPMPYGCRWLLRFADIRLRIILLWQEAAEPWPIANESVDSWFLDGFAPSKNPEMWQADIAKRIRAYSKPNAVLATFSSARIVRDTLQAEGFHVEKRPGILGKREVLRARLHGALCGASGRHTLQPRTVAVIGAGIAGLELAHHLTEYGARVHVFEKAEKVASAASANPAVIHRPKVTADHSARSKLSLAGFHYQKMRIRQAHAHAAQKDAPPFAHYPGVWWQPDNLELIAKHNRAFGAPLYEVREGREGLYMPSAGWFDMGAYCQHLAERIENLHLNIGITGVVATSTSNSTSASANPTTFKVQADSADNASSIIKVALTTAFDAVVFTTGAAGFAQHADLHKAFGAMHRAPYDSEHLPHDARIFSGNGGMIAHDDELYLGASFIRNAAKEPTPSVSLAENEARAAYFIAKNNMAGSLAALTPFWSGTRAMARNQSAYVVRLDSDNHGFDWVIDTHSEAASGRGVHAFTGLGAQGSTLAAITAERIAAAIMGVEHDAEITHHIISA